MTQAAGSTFIADGVGLVLSAWAVDKCTGYLVQQTGHYSAALLVSAFVGLAGLVAWLVVLPTVRWIDWSADSSPDASV